MYNKLYHTKVKRRISFIAKHDWRSPEDNNDNGSQKRKTKKLISRVELKNAITVNKSINISEKLRLLKSYDQVPDIYKKEFLDTHLNIIPIMKDKISPVKSKHSNKKQKIRVSSI